MQRLTGLGVLRQASPCRPHHPHTLDRIASLQSELRNTRVDPQFHGTLKKLNLDTAQGLFNELNCEFEFQHHALSPDDSFEASMRAKGWDLSYGMLATAALLESYEVRGQDTPLLIAINPQHKHRLCISFQKSFRSMTPTEQDALTSVISVSAMVELGLVINQNLKDVSRYSAKIGLPQLEMSHVLALIDYCHVSTGSFKATNVAQRVCIDSDVSTLAIATTYLRQPLQEALSILKHYPCFVHKGAAYKGVNLQNPAGSYRLSQAQAGKLYKLSHMWSASTRQEKNYACQHYLNTNEPRDTQITIVGTQAIKVHLFNDASTRDQFEVLIPEDTTLRFLALSEIDTQLFKPNPDAYLTLYCTSEQAGSHFL